MHSLHNFEVSVLQIHYITICISARAGIGVVLGAVKGPAPAVRAGLGTTATRPQATPTRTNEIHETE